MAVYLTAAAVFLFYAGQVPLNFAFYLHIDRGAHFGAGLCAFAERFALNAARARALGQKPHWPWKRAEKDAKRFGFPPHIMRMLQLLRRGAHVRSIALIGRVARPDAAETALICGLCSAIDAALPPSAPVTLRLTPDFSAAESDITLSGIFYLSAGHIMLAALLGAIDYGNGRLAQWKNTRLKAS